MADHPPLARRGVNQAIRCTVSVIITCVIVFLQDRALVPALDAC